MNIIRKYIWDEIVLAFTYVDADGKKLSSVTVGYLFQHEIDFIQNKFGQKVTKLGNGYFMISFKRK